MNRVFWLCSYEIMKLCLLKVYEDEGFQVTAPSKGPCHTGHGAGRAHVAQAIRFRPGAVVEVKVEDCIVKASQELVLLGLKLSETRNAWEMLA